MSAEKIREALGKLDVNQDPHWTQDGQPSVNIVNIYAGGKHSRDEIEQAWPGFRRTNAVELLAVGYSQAEQETAAPAVPPAPPVPQDTAQDSTSSESTSQDAAQSVVNTDGPSAKEEIEQELAAIDKYIDQAQARKHVLRAELDKILIEEGTPNDPFWTANAAYLASQQKVMQDRAKRMQQIREAGITPKMLDALIPKGSPVDQALSRRPRS